MSKPPLLEQLRAAGELAPTYPQFLQTLSAPRGWRIADGGMRLDNCFCTNSICAPSRATILTGKYSHENGQLTNFETFDGSQQTFPKLLQQHGYQSAIFGKWHLGTGPNHCPTGFDDWAVVPGQGRYHNPEFIFKGPNGGTTHTVQGYVTDLITDISENQYAIGL
mgnify:CR=1 FL=1